jgi:(2Fe-2S) ferredoxin
LPGKDGAPGAVGGRHTLATFDRRIRAAMSYFQRHVFFCLNERPAPDACCAVHQSAQMQAYAKERVKRLGIAGPGKVRINKAGCLDRCESGPCLVVYPEAVWYTYVDRNDIDEIIESHLVGGKVVGRLRLP